MSDFSLRLPYLIYLSIGSILLGVLLAPLFRPTPVLAIPENMRDHAMIHGSIEIPPEGAPEMVSGEKIAARAVITQEQSGPTGG